MTKEVPKNDIEISKLTIEKLLENDITPTPQCYEVMFAYLKGDNIEVNKAFEKYFKKHQLITESFLNKVHSSVLYYDTMAKTVNTVTSLLTNQISDLNHSVITSDQEIGVFNEAIDSFSQYIEDDIDNFSDKNIVNYIINATSRIKDKIKELEESLNNSQIEIKQLHSYLENMCQETMIDPLTALATRKKSDQILSRAIRNSLETSEELAIVFVEIDYYDQFQEKWGQATSEQILRFTATALKENIKGRDSASRYSETIFMLILPKTSAKGAKALSEHIRNTIERKRIVKKTTGEYLGRVTISAGIAEFKEGESLGYLVSRAEKSLTAARLNGRNCSVTEDETNDILSNLDNDNNDQVANG